MSYQVLARKWRPRNFAELAGQEHVVRALANALDNNRLHHAYLLTGTRGVGKTTIARILAKSLNCETGVTSKPCGVCAACVAIDEGRFVDLIELDAASNTGIDNMREILDNARYAPTVGRYKVYLIDEVHMLSKAAFNSMLKTLEEPPEHVKFVLATTDPQKIPVTVLSRCLQFNLKQLPPAVVAGQLEHVLREEKIAFEPGAVRVLARAASGSMRDGLSLLDQAIAHGGGSVVEAMVREMIGSVDGEFVVTLLEAIADRDVERVFAESKRLAERNLSFDTALSDLAVALHDIALLQMAPGAVAPDVPARDRLAALAGKMNAEDVQLDYQIAVQGRADLPLAPDEYAGFTMTLMRMLAFAPDAGGGDARRAEPLRAKPPTRTVATADVPARASSLRSAPETAPQVMPGPSLRTVPATAAQESIVSSRSASDSTRDSKPEDAPARAAAVAEATLAKAATPAATATAETAVAPADADLVVSDASLDDWPQWIARCKLTGMALQLANNAELRAHRRTPAGIELDLVLDESNRHLAETGYRDKLSEALSAPLGARVRLKVEIGPARDTSIAAQDKRARQALQDEATAAFNADPFVRDAMRLFDARIRPQTIQPISSGAAGATEQGPKA